MKKFLLSIVLLMGGLMVSAQTADDFKASLKRITKMVKLTQTQPQDCGIASVNELATESGKMAMESLQISQTIHQLNKRIEANDIDASLLEQLTGLGERIKSQTEATQSVTKKIPEASKEIAKIKNPLELKKATKSLSYSKNALQMTTEETIFQTKTIAAMIQTVSTANLK